jgi:hypothetical protein
MRIQTMHALITRKETEIDSGKCGVESRATALRHQVGVASTATWARACTGRRALWEDAGLRCACSTPRMCSSSVSCAILSVEHAWLLQMSASTMTQGLPSLAHTESLQRG